MFENIILLNPADRSCSQQFRDDNLRNIILRILELEQQLTSASQRIIVEPSRRFMAPSTRLLAPLIPS